jgi:hypothetical protein
LSFRRNTDRPHRSRGAAVTIRPGGRLLIMSIDLYHFFYFKF